MSPTRSAGPSQLPMLASPPPRPPRSPPSPAGVEGPVRTHPCAHTLLGEQLIDILTHASLAGFAAELETVRLLGNTTCETRERVPSRRDSGYALEAPCGASAVHGVWREDTQLIRAASRSKDARVRALVVSGAPHASAGGTRARPHGRERLGASALSRRCSRPCLNPVGTLRLHLVASDPGPCRIDLPSCLLNCSHPQRNVGLQPEEISRKDACGHL